MAIKKIYVKEFAVFTDFSIDLNPGINIIIGENGVGKTLLLKLIYASAVSQRLFKEKNRTEKGIDISNEIIKESIMSTFGIDLQYIETVFQKSAFSSKHDGIYFPQPVFIPAKEMLTHAKGLLSMKKKYGANMPFDITLLDIIEKAQAWKLSEMPEIAKKTAPKLEEVIDGTVEVNDDGSFWMKKKNGDIIPFSMEAEGLKKLGLLWQLLMNESITENSIVLWDEPESSINPVNIPILVEAMLEMQRHGVQIIAATHSYNFARYFDILYKKNDIVQFNNLTKKNNRTKHISYKKFIDIKTNNSIDDAGERLYEDVIQKSLEDMDDE